MSSFMAASSKGRTTSMSKASGWGRSRSSLKTPTTAAQRSSRSSMTSLTENLGQVEEHRAAVGADGALKESFDERNRGRHGRHLLRPDQVARDHAQEAVGHFVDRKSTRLNSSHLGI